MERWIHTLTKNSRGLAQPLLAYPAVQLLGVTVTELVRSPELQAEGMRLLAERYPMPLAIGYMDLSVEAEAFGAKAVYSDGNIPTIVGQLISEEEEANALQAPPVGAGRTGVALEGIRLALEIIPDRPVIANCIGPYSLAGRLMNVNEIMLDCYEEPDMVHTVLRKVTDFLRSYIAAFKEAGANGIVLAEPLAGILSPALMQEFSTDYVKELTEDLQSEDFPFIYHNCGTAVNRLLPQVLDTGCLAYHFGNHVSMQDILANFPSDRLAMGNISPSSVLNGMSPEGVREAVSGLLAECGSYPNFLLSSGCDVPPHTPLENLSAFFAAQGAFCGFC